MDSKKVCGWGQSAVFLTQAGNSAACSCFSEREEKLREKRTHAHASVLRVVLHSRIVCILNGISNLRLILHARAHTRAQCKRPLHNSCTRAQFLSLHCFKNHLCPHKACKTCKENVTSCLFLKIIFRFVGSSHLSHACMDRPPPQEKTGSWKLHLCVGLCVRCRTTSYYIYSARTSGDTHGSVRLPQNFLF